MCRGLKIRIAFRDLKSATFSQKGFIPQSTTLFKEHSLFKWYAGGLLAALLLGVGYGEEVYDLGRIEVLAKEKVDNNATLEVIKQKDIQNTASSDVAQALRYQSGMFYQPAASPRGEPNIGIRGYDYVSTGFFIDGIPVHSIYDRQTDWAQFSTFGIAEIDVSKGFTSPIYGMNTLGGAVNVITSKPINPFELNARYGFVSNNENQASLQVGGNSGKVYYSLGYAFIGRDSLPLSHHFEPTQYQPTGEKINSYYKNHTFRAKVGFEPNENHEYSLNLIYQKGEKGGMFDANTGGNFWQWPHYDKITAYLLGRSKFTDSLSLDTRLYYDRFYNRLDSYGRVQADGNHGAWSFGSIYDDYTLGGIFTLGVDFDADKNLKFGLNLKNDNTDHGDSVAPGSTSTNDNNKIKDLSTSIFAEYAQRFNQTFRFVLNGSYDRNDVTYAVIDTQPPSRHLQGWTLQGILYANANDYSTLYANVGKKNKLPTLKDRFGSTWGSRIPAPNLEPESALNYELGVKFDYESTHFSLAGFYNDLNNMIISAGTSDTSCANGTSCVILENAKEGYAYGAEVSLKQGFIDDKIVFGANYSYVERKATNTNGSSYGVDGSRILNYPNHIANASLIIAPIKQFDVMGFATFQSKQWYGVGGGRNSPITAYGQNKDIFLLDVKANYRPIEALQFSVGAYNLLDKNYYYSSGYYMAGRRILASVEYKF